MLDFVHTNTCAFVDEYPTVENLSTLIEAADRYGIKSLVKRCSRLLTRKLTSDNVFKIWDLARRCDDGHTLLEACRHYMDGLPGSQVAEMARVYLATASPRASQRYMASSHPDTACTGEAV
eukprot:Blabericola_migrator_1__11934@NODE_72_length_15243_cov_214_481220_g65_i0_p12_GENE_NODE_72_length_15243_cov_214_481220_g65_i0NODE_72_length_15243_cov_214_481220_g65_i0_p12_ORF_typecomplete_len121_score22_42BTB/PF00651_31/0_00073BTB/PF00651_31/5_8e02_NODE_72_length_15243_cov_214_481220_g65_i081978559